MTAVARKHLEDKDAIMKTQRGLSNEKSDQPSHVLF